MIAVFIKHQQGNTSSKRVCPFVWELAKQCETQSLITMGSILGRFQLQRAHCWPADSLWVQEPRGAEAETQFPPGTRLYFLSPRILEVRLVWLDRRVRSPQAQRLHRWLKQGPHCRGQLETATEDGRMGLAHSRVSLRPPKSEAL